MKIIYLLLFFVTFTSIAQNTIKRKEKINLIIDADTANELDDLFAIVRAINAPEFNLIGITSAQFHTSPLASAQTANESYVINKDLIALLNTKHIKILLGSNQPLKNTQKPQPSEAANFIIKKAHQTTKNNPLNLVILGSCTNVASAILMDPSIIPKIKVYYLGFWHTPSTNSYNKQEFNSRNDFLAVNFLLNQPKLDLSVMTATTSQHLIFKKDTALKNLQGTSNLGDYLMNRWETYNRWWTKKDRLKTTWTMWDLAIIEALAHPEWTTSSLFTTPPENTQRNIKIYTKIDVEKMKKDFWQHIKHLPK